MVIPPCLQTSWRHRWAWPIPNIYCRLLMVECGWIAIFAVSSPFGRWWHVHLVPVLDGWKLRLSFWSFDTYRTRLEAPYFRIGTPRFMFYTPCLAFYVCCSSPAYPRWKSPWIQEASPLGECLPGGVFDDDVQTEVGPCGALREQLVLIDRTNHWCFARKYESCWDNN